MEGSPLELSQRFATLNSNSAATALPRWNIITSTQPRAQGGQVDVLIFYFGRAVAAECEFRVENLCDSSKGEPSDPMQPKQRTHTWCRHRPTTAPSPSHPQRYGSG